MAYIAHAAKADAGDLETGTRVCLVCDQRKAMAEFHWAAGQRALADEYGCSQGMVSNIVRNRAWTAA